MAEETDEVAAQRVNAKRLAANRERLLHLVLKKISNIDLRFRPEIFVPTNHADRIKEGIFLKNIIGNAYSGDLVHEQPLFLLAFEILQEYGLDSIAITVSHFACGILLSWVGREIAIDIVKGLKRNKVSESSLSLMPHAEDYVNSMGDWILKAYFCNPLVLLTYISESTSIFNNICLAASLYGTVKGSMVLSSIFLALAAYRDLYAIPMLIPSTVYIISKKNCLKTQRKWPSMYTYVFLNLTIFITTLGFFLFYSFKITGTWKFLDATYGFVLKVTDLRPNIGLFWYFFIEVFGDFSNFFLYVFQVNTIFYIVPLTMRFHKHPPLLIYAVMSLLAIYKAYPSIADIGIYISLSPLWIYTFNHTWHSLQLLFMFVVSCILGPIFWSLWIYSGTANANFFYAMTLFFNASQIFLLTNIVLGKIKCDFFSENGLDLTIDEKKVSLCLE
ncbi:phosphatidylinositol glycan anchor biosynthesis class U protein-like [Artemia franciscana]|uniref:phosphatidylinositol glycan anchor biosynthesis class U protein-like n=1 Tax=Artemia franciscana TaxID=6661 RepID=UPI0032DB0464